MIGRLIVAMLICCLSMLGIASPASAQTLQIPRTLQPLQPYGPCGDHFQLTRSGTDVHVIGLGLYAFSNGYMLVWPSDDYGTNYGSYNASPYGGANFWIDTGQTSSEDIGIDLTDASNTQTLCASTYYV